MATSSFCWWCVAHFSEPIKTSTKLTENVLDMSVTCVRDGDKMVEYRWGRKLFFFRGFFSIFFFFYHFWCAAFLAYATQLPQDDRQYECKLKTHQRRHAETGWERGGKKRKVKDARKNCAQCGNENKCACVSYQCVGFCFLGDENR